MEHGSKIYTPYRSIGLVSNDVPLIVRYINTWKEHLIVTSIGNSFQTYDEHKLRLINVGNTHVDPIRCLAGDTYHIYTGSGCKIFAWRRTSELIHCYSVKSNVQLILPFGPHIICVDKNNNFYVFNIKTEELFLEIEFPQNFIISSILHPATYINKILLGSRQGSLQLWNIKSNKLVYTLNGWNSEVRVLQQSPAQDVVGVGLANGAIYLQNLKYDETVLHFKQDWGAITSISFRTDGAPIMVSGSELGHIAVWNLEERRLSSQIMEAHKKSVTGLTCLTNEPRMVTSSSDNTLKIWIFDMSDGGARLQLFKEGHAAPPLMARFHGSLGNTILTGGEDSTVRQFSTSVDLVNRSLGQASYNRKAAKRNSSNREKLKMPAITAFTTESTQEKSWDNIACMHRNIPTITLWSFENQKMGEHKLVHKRFSSKFQNAAASCLDLSVCGNYVIIGYDTGHLDKYNIQSAIWKGSFKDRERAHSNIICGVVSDGLNQTVVSGDQDGLIKWWKFRTLCKSSQLQFECGISGLNLHRESGLLGIVFEDWTICIADIDTRKVIRKFTGHSNQITDVTFSTNSKWFVSASLDLTIRTWDLPSGSCVDMFSVPVAATSISFASTDDLFATIHAGNLGVYLWANRSCFQHISLFPLPLDFEPPLIPLPSMGTSERIELLKQGEDQSYEVQENAEIIEYTSPDQISEELISLSLLPTSRWLNLLHSDTLRKKNKPIEPPKVPKTAPFFIPTVPGIDFKLDLPDGATTGNEISKLKSSLTFESLSPFGVKLKEQNYSEAFQMLLAMGPSSIDTEIRGLDPYIGGSEELVCNLLKMLKSYIVKKQYFESCQGFLSLILKLHADFIKENETAQNLCAKLAINNSTSWNSVQNSLNQSLSLISYFKNAAVINY